MRRRPVLAAAALLLAGGLAAATVVCGTAGAGPEAGRRVIILGFDGLDYGLTKRLMEEGRLPNFSRLEKAGGFAPLATAVPPQSPVAWSSFITGLDPGGHGIFDFIHRDPKTMLPYLSTSRTEPPGRFMKIGRWQFPLRSGRTVLLRHGASFWEVLEEAGVATTIVRMPANYPPSGTASRELSGMGTPDVLGTYGTFSFYTSDRLAFSGKDVSGGKVYHVTPSGNVVRAKLAGPKNDLLVEGGKLEAEFEVHLDPDRAAAMIVVGDERRLLQQGEWSDWVPVDFPIMPTQSLRAMGIFYLRQVRPTFELYVSPLNIDPFAPAQPISTPASYAAKLAEATGRYYTQGMPEDTKALSEGVFNPEEFLHQARIAGDENLAQYRRVLEEFGSGLLFYYFGNVDQISHMMWRSLDPEHPAYSTERDGPYSDVIPSLYEQLDGVVGHTLDRMGEGTTLVVMSDHGFASWRRAFHLNTWLKENGYLTLKDSAGGRSGPFFAGVDWYRTRAYGLGLNGLYINLLGRERNGIVDPKDRRALMEEIAAKLLETVDPSTGLRAVTKAYLREEVYRHDGFPDISPDIQVGYAKNMRGSNESALGEVPPEVIIDNTEPWSGDHCMDHEAVPGILLTSRPLAKPAGSLETLAAAILAEFGIEVFPPND